MSAKGRNCPLATCRKPAIAAAVLEADSGMGWRGSTPVGSAAPDNRHWRCYPVADVPNRRRVWGALVADSRLACEPPAGRAPSNKSRSMSGATIVSLSRRLVDMAHALDCNHIIPSSAHGLFERGQE